MPQPVNYSLLCVKPDALFDNNLSLIEFISENTN